MSVKCEWKGHVGNPEVAEVCAGNFCRACHRDIGVSFERCVAGGDFVPRPPATNPLLVLSAASETRASRVH